MSKSRHLDVSKALPGFDPLPAYKQPLLGLYSNQINYIYSTMPIIQCSKPRHVPNLNYRCTRAYIRLQIKPCVSCVNVNFTKRLCPTTYSYIIISHIEKLEPAALVGWLGSEWVDATEAAMEPWDLKSVPYTIIEVRAERLTTNLTLLRRLNSSGLVNGWDRDGGEEVGHREQ